MKHRTRDEIAASISSRFIILCPDGTEIPGDAHALDSGQLASFPSLAALVAAELGRQQAVEAPPSIQAMQQLELADYEPASDSGHFRFYPKGNLIFELLRMWAEEIALERLQAYAITTPLIYDWDQPDIRAQAESFHEHHYRVQVPDDEQKKFILRFAGDFGLFRMVRDAQLTYRHLPLRLFEFAPSFRYERSGSLVGLRRLRAFWMPDIHSFCLNLEQGLSEYRELHDRYTDLAIGTGVSFAVAFRVVESFYQQHRQQLIEMARYVNQPIWIELLSEMKHYWVMKHELTTIGVRNDVCQVSTVQLDVKDSELYGITYVGPDGAKKGCTIVHSSIGSPERWIYSILEDALKKDAPQLPLWLAPTQVRFLPVADRHVNFCAQLARLLQKQKVRVDVDDRPDTLNRRVRNAGRDWVPYTIVCGDQEIANGVFSKLALTVRGKNKTKATLNEIADRVHQKTNKMPFRALPGLLLSASPVFRGRD